MAYLVKVGWWLWITQTCTTEQNSDVFKYIEGVLTAEYVSKSV